MSEGPTTPAVEPGPPTGPASPPPAPRGRLVWLDALLSDSTVRGIVVALLMSIAGLGIGLSCLTLQEVGAMLCYVFMGGAGLVQLLWIVPLDRWAAHRGRSRLRKGLWIGASVVFLLNGTCWGVIAGSIGRAR